jgi:hypothetical protein
MVINKDPQATLLRYLRASKGSPQHAADKIHGGCSNGARNSFERSHQRAWLGVPVLTPRRVAAPLLGGQRLR